MASKMNCTINGKDYYRIKRKIGKKLNSKGVWVDDYKTILNEILKQKETDIKKIGIEWEGEVLNIPGIQWIIRGTRLGLREIKDRLNIAFSLFYMKGSAEMLVGI